MLLASFLIVFMVFGCAESADPAASSTSPCSGSSAGRARASEGTSIERSGPKVAAEEISARDARAGWQAPAEPVKAEPPAETLSGDSSDSAFGGARDLDDPFAVIGPAFSGIGFQSYSSGCDPFEDTYGTCL